MCAACWARFWVERRADAVKDCGLPSKFAMTGRSPGLEGEGRVSLDDLEQQKDQDDGEDQAQAAAAVVSQSRPHAITAKTEQQDQDDEKEDHFLYRSPGKRCTTGGTMLNLMLASLANPLFCGG